MRIKIATVLVLTCLTLGQAQELTIGINGGISGMRYNSGMGEGSPNLGGAIGIGYTHYLNDRWGIHGGIGLHYGSNDFELTDGRTVTSYEVDDQGSAFEYRVVPSGYGEQQHFYALAVPLQLRYHIPFSSAKGMYIGIGGTLLVPGDQQVSASARTLSLVGYYPDLNLEITDLPSHGFGERVDYKGSTSIGLGPSVLLSVEGGLSFRLKVGAKLYTGVYADYGLTDLAHTGGHKNLVGYSPTGINDIVANGALSSSQVVESARYLSAGVQVKIGFGTVQKQQGPVVENQTPAEAPAIVDPAPKKQELVRAGEKAEAPKVPVRVLSQGDIDFIEAPLVFATLDRTDLSAGMRERLDRIVPLLQKDTGVKVVITGHTCNLGSGPLNEKIGLQRAEAVAVYLVGQGISEERIRIRSKGETEPLVPNTSSENRARNRRVAIDLLGMDGADGI